MPGVPRGRCHLLRSWSYTQLWVLRTKSGSSGRTTNVLNCWTISGVSCFSLNETYAHASPLMKHFSCRIFFICSCLFIILTHMHICINAHKDTQEWVHFSLEDICVLLKDESWSKSSWRPKRLAHISHYSIPQWDLFSAAMGDFQFHETLTQWVSSFSSL